MLVRELMRVHPVKIGPEATLAEAVDMFDLYQTPILPVVDTDGTILGIVEQERLCLPLLTVAVGTGSSVSKWSTPVTDVMTDAASVEVTSELEEAAMRIAETGNRILVTESGRLVGTIGCVEIAQAVFDRDRPAGFPDAQPA